MRYVDTKTWSRREHFKLYSAFDHPHFGMCANLDLTAFHPAVKQRGRSMTVAITHVVSRAANAVPQFKYRIRGTQVVEHEIVHPSVTIMTEDDLFSFCTFEYSDDFSEFAAGAAEAIARVKAQPSLKDEPGRDDLLFMTAIPWVSFTSFTHPLNLEPADSVPRFAWGRFFQEGDSLRMPLAVQGHHALMDGLHVGRLYAQVQAYLDDPEAVLG